MCGARYASTLGEFTMAKKKQNFGKLTRDYLQHQRASHIEKTETHNYYGRNKNDLFGFADWVAVMDFKLPELWFIQETSRSNISARKKKICNSEIACTILDNPSSRIFILGWDKCKEGMWRVKKVEITSRDMEAGYLCVGELKEPYWKEG